MIRIWPPFEFHLNSTPAQGTRGVRGIFFRGGKVIFPWQKILVLVHPKQILVVLKSEKKIVFPSFLLHFFFFPCLSFPVGQQKFPSEKCRALCPPAPCVTPLLSMLLSTEDSNSKKSCMSFVCLFVFVCLYVVLKDIINFPISSWNIHLLHSAINWR